jgi:hypothetical protein
MVHSVSDSNDRVPADTLLMRARFARARQHAPSDEEVVFEQDEIVQTDDGRDSHVTSTRSAASLRRSLAEIDFGSIEWSGKVDHTALQAALACTPQRGTLVEGPYFQAMLEADDAAILERLAERLAADSAGGVAAAAALPNLFVGADPQLSDEASAALDAYRRASLVHAWQAVLGGSANADVERERDSSAVQLMTLLRKLSSGG